MNDWTVPGAHHVSEGIYRIPLPLPTDGLRAVNVYAIEGDTGLTLIDGGWAVEAARTQLERSLLEIGYRVRDIRRFLVTHAHRDHYTQAAVVRSEFGTHVSLGIGEEPALRYARSRRVGPDPIVQRLERAGALDLRRSWQERSRSEPPTPDQWLPPDTWLDGDLTLDISPRTLKAMPTPGHTAGHYVFADLVDGLLFAGDHVLPTITPSIGFQAIDVSQPLGDFLDSLVKVRMLPDMRLLPAHGPVTHSSHARVDELLVHHDERLELCQQAVGAGATTAYDVAAELPWTRRHRRFADLDAFNAGLAALETLAHLELLAERGVIERHEPGDGVLHYSVGREARTDIAVERT